MVAGCQCRDPALTKTNDFCAPEKCDGLDNDCDDLVDEDLGELRCGAGICARAVFLCVGGVEQVCIPGPASNEVCDGEDDDCNGVVDDGFPRDTCGRGECLRTVSFCENRQIPICVPGEPSAEICDGKDNDCDGELDEGLGSTSCGSGACARTVDNCSGGVAQSCTAGAPATEVCDGLDNDCDGATDELLGSTTCGTGTCERTGANCAAGMTQSCTAGTPATEVCDGLDNDCDGATDELLAPLSCGTGECARTVAACVAGMSQTCTPGMPSPEVCDGLDNDCDGTPDSSGICQPPQVMCPASTSALVGTTLTFTASATDPDGTIVSTTWTVPSRPAGSTAMLSSPGTPSTDFTPDRAGTYTLQFCARDNGGNVRCCTTSLATTTCASPPAPPVSTACGTSWDGRPIVEFSPVPAGLVYELTSSGAPLVLASASAGQNHLRPATRIAAGGAMPGTPTALEVRSCRTAEPTCCSAASALSVDVVADCSAAVAPSSANIVLSEYVTNGEGTCPSPNCVTQDTCQAGEAIEITNLSNCPVALDGHHFAYRNSSATTSSYRWMNFGAADVIPPRGVYVAIRNRQFAPVCAASIGPDDSGLFGSKVSSLTMQGSSLCSGWFNNTGGGQSELRVAAGTIPTGGTPSFSPGSAIVRIAPYLPTSGSLADCVSVGFDAVDSCGSIVGGSVPTTPINPNQLGRLWHPCDAVTSPVPACVRD